MSRTQRASLSFLFSLLAVWAPQSIAQTPHAAEAEQADWDVPPKFKRGRVPLYPLSYIRAGKPASAVISYTVTEKGKAENVKVVRTSDQAFAGHIAAAISVWSHHPATKDGKPVAATVSREFILSK